jgi:hypothetical protein
MKKKEYTKPEMQTISYENEAPLLAGSGEDNPYWTPPEKRKVAKPRGGVRN